MNVSNRQRQMIALLLQHPSGLTAADIAEQIGISVRTVHREFEQVERLLELSNIKLVKKAGSGVLIQGSQEQITQLSQKIVNVVSSTYSTDIRKYLVLCQLLQETEPIKLFSLAHDYNVAVPTISSDLDELEPFLTSFRIHIIRKRGYGVELAGTELAFRRVIFALANQFLEESDYFDLRNISTSTTLKVQILELVNKDTFYEVLQALAHLESVTPTKLSESAYTTLIIQLSIAINRIKRGFVVSSFKSGKTSSLTQDFLQLVHLTVLETEQHYIADLLAKWHTEEQALLLPDSSLPLMNLSVNLTKLVEQKLQFTLLPDDSLIEGMHHHLDLALQRIKNGEKIRNPLLVQIKKDYATLYEAVSYAAKQIWKTFVMPEEEIGFLVMHFGASIERAKLLKQPVRALVVCTSGIGSSKLLAVRIKKELPQIELLGHVSWFEATRTPRENYDLIISTVDLPIESNRYIRISPLLLPAEVERLRQFIMLLPPKFNETPEFKQSVHKLTKLGSAADRLTWMRDYVQEAISIINQFDQIDIPMTGNELAPLLLKICSIASERIKITNVARVAQKLLQREQYGSQRIPQTALALLHTRSTAISQPIVLLFRLTDGSIMKENDDDGVRTLLLMLAPEQLTKATLTVLSEFSALLMRPDMIDHLMTSDIATIQLFIAEQLESIIQTTMEWRNER